jgi:hypothetical protein
MSKNDITGDEIKSKVSSTYADNYDKIFRKDTVESVDTSANKLAQCPHYPDLCFCTGACKNGWDEKRIDIIGSNGNEGIHYESK